MVSSPSELHTDRDVLSKCPTGIAGLDTVTEGGLPRGRPTLICGSAGCGKTLFAVEFLVRGAVEFDEPGVFMAFEETAEELAQNVKSLGFNLDELVASNKLSIDHVRVDRSEIEETGEYDLEGLFVRLNHAIDSIGAKRVVLDTVETLFGGLSDSGVLRSEIRRLFRWLKDKGVTTIVTGERGEGTLTRQGLEEYVSDCVVVLDHRVTEQISTRRLRIVKYRGSAHGTNEFPFLIDEDGITVVPITSAGMDHPASLERVSSGITELDRMLGGKGYYRGSSVLISGSAGIGKTSLATHFAVASCERGEQCLYFSFEESTKQLVRNMNSIGLSVERWIDKGLLRVEAARPTQHGLEFHLSRIHKLVQNRRPQTVVIDPISNFIAAGTFSDTGTMLVRMVDYFKSQNITTLFTTLLHSGEEESILGGVSSIIDTWLLLRTAETDGECSASLRLLKSRGMSHSKQVKDFKITDQGVVISGTSPAR